MKDTVNGKPLEEVLEEYRSAEIQATRKEEIAVPLNKHTKTRHTGNHSNTKTPPGKVVYVAGQKATHVIYKRCVFDWLVKSVAFVPSGQSIQGALEYAKATEELRCHECGEWFSKLSWHIRNHGITVREYRKRHGLTTGARKTSLQSPGLPKAVFPRELSHSFTKQERDKGRSSAIESRIAKSLSDDAPTELANFRDICLAQIPNRLQMLAANLGRTPTAREIAGAGLSRGTIVKRFGTVAAAIRQAGLQPRALSANFKRKRKTLDVSA